MLPLQNADPARDRGGPEQLFLSQVPGATTGARKEARTEAESGQRDDQEATKAEKGLAHRRLGRAR